MCCLFSFAGDLVPPLLVRPVVVHHRSRLRCVYASDEQKVDQVLPIEERQTASGVAQVVFLRLPPAGVVIYEGEAA
jgi:hypothetical protein